MEIVTATGEHNQRIYSEKLPARGIIRRNLGTEILGRILDFHLRSLQNSVNSNKMVSTFLPMNMGLF